MCSPPFLTMGKDLSESPPLVGAKKQKRRGGEMKIYDFNPIKYIKGKKANELAKLMHKLEPNTYPPRLEKFPPLGMGYLVVHKKYTNVIGTPKERIVLQRGTFFQIDDENEEDTMIYEVWVKI